MVRQMDGAMIVPQHGWPFAGPEMINRFLDWVSGQESGIALLMQLDYRYP